eukprot:Gb_34099 [translate_table: standard]
MAKAEAEAVETEMVGRRRSCFTGKIMRRKSCGGRNPKGSSCLHSFTDFDSFALHAIARLLLQRERERARERERSGAIKPHDFHHMRMQVVDPSCQSFDNSSCVQSVGFHKMAIASRQEPKGKEELAFWFWFGLVSWCVGGASRRDTYTATGWQALLHNEQCPQRSKVVVWCLRIIVWPDDVNEDYFSLSHLFCAERSKKVLYACMTKGLMGAGESLNMVEGGPITMAPRHFYGIWNMGSCAFLAEGERIDGIYASAVQPSLHGLYNEQDSGESPWIYSRIENQTGKRLQRLDVLCSSHLNVNTPTVCVWRNGGHRAYAERPRPKALAARNWMYIPNGEHRTRAVAEELSNGLRSWAIGGNSWDWKGDEDDDIDTNKLGMRERGGQWAMGVSTEGYSSDGVHGSRVHLLPKIHCQRGLLSDPKMRTKKQKVLLALSNPSLAVSG